MMNQNNLCRLCKGTLEKSFKKQILNAYDIQYYSCNSCNSLQTELPYWLAEAYRPENECFDTGQVIRGIHNVAILNALVSHLKLQKNLIVDYGCGSGLAVRLMRDLGLNAFGYDSYSTPRLAVGFHVNTTKNAEVINLCEVAEHFDEPITYFDEIFSSQPKLLLMQTEIYASQDSNWKYLTPEHGQHIFFYSEKSIQFIANRYKMAATFFGGHIIFFSPSILNDLFIPESGKLQPNLLEKLQNSVPNLMMSLATNQYKFATLDSENLLESKRNEFKIL